MVLKMSTDGQKGTEALFFGFFHVRKLAMLSYLRGAVLDS